MTSHDHDLVKWAPSRLYRKHDGIGQIPCSYECYLVIIIIIVIIHPTILYTSSTACCRPVPNFVVDCMLT